MKSMNYLNQFTNTQMPPKLKHINLVNPNNNMTSNNDHSKFYRTQTNKSITTRNNNYFYSENTVSSSTKGAKNEEERQKNIKNAINRLLEINNPVTTPNPPSVLEKEKNIQLTIKNQNEPKILLSQNKNNPIENKKKTFSSNNIKNISYKNNDVRNQSLNDINEDFMVISNRKINKNLFNNYENKTNKNNMISSEIKNIFGMSKKYPEPEDIDDNLINTHVEPIPDLEHHSKIQKIEMDDLNQFDLPINNKVINKQKSNKEKRNSNMNNNNIKSKMEVKNIDKKNNKQSDDKEIYIKNRVLDEDILFKSSDEE
jgi:hypothetical protein